jgi:hypothetical protein
VLKTIILWLTFFFACFLPASAPTITAPEKRIWVIFSIGYDAAPTEVTNTYDRSAAPTLSYDTAPNPNAANKEKAIEVRRAKFRQITEFKAAEGSPALGETIQRTIVIDGRQFSFRAFGLPGGKTSVGTVVEGVFQRNVAKP